MKKGVTPIKQRKRKKLEEFDEPNPKKMIETTEDESFKVPKERETLPNKIEDKERDFEEETLDNFKTPIKEDETNKEISEIDEKEKNSPNLSKNPENLYSLDSITNIQSSIRGYLVRKDIIKIQSFFRGELERKKTKKMKESIENIQSIQKDSLIKESSLQIQKFFKQILIKRKLRKEQVSKEQKISEACTIITGAIENYLELRDSFDFLRGLMERKCIVRIQSVFRGYLVRRETEDLYEDMIHEKATLIQKIFRGFSVRLRFNKFKKAIEKQREIEQEMKHRIEINIATGILQSLFRGILTRKHFEDYKTKMNQAAIKIQCRRRIQLAKRKIKMVSRYRDEEISKKKGGLFEKYFKSITDFGYHLFFHDMEEKDDWKKKVLKLEKQNQEIEKYIETPSNVEFLLNQKKKELEIIEKEKQVLKGFKKQTENLPKDFYEYKKNFSDLKFKNDSKEESIDIKYDQIISYQPSPSKPRKKRPNESLISQPKKKMKSDEDGIFKKPPLFPKTIVFK